MTFRSIKSGLRNLFGHGNTDRELSEELDHYLAEATREHMRAGLSRVDAERAARADMGSISSVKEQALSANWETRLESFLKDVRFGLRAIRRNPGFAAAAILTIALGTGANTAVFSVVNAVMLRPLPWPDAGKLALVWTDDVRRGLHTQTTAYPTITDWQSASHTFQEIAYFTTQRVAPMSNEPGGERGRSRSALVSPNLFGLLGVAPEQGRLISDGDHASRAPVAVISHAFWQRWFGGAPDIIGKTLTVDDPSKGGLGTVTVIGVMPPAFYFPDLLTEIWTPASTYSRFALESSERFASSARRWTAIGRLAPGASMDDARGELATIGRQLASNHVSSVQDFPGFETSIVSILDSITGQNVQSALWMLLGAVSLVLLVGCANVANLLLARGAARHQEFALRRALGAGRGHILRQLLTESLLLSLAGGTVGTALAIWLTNLLASAASGFVPRINEVAVDWRVLGFALLASLVAGLAFGLGPAIQLSNSNAGEALRDGNRGTGRVRLRRSRDLLVTAECALALVLLAGAGLLLRSLEHLHSIDPGFDPQNVLTMRIEFPTELPTAPAEQTQTSNVALERARARVALASQLVDGVSALPGVTAAGFSDDLFVAGQGNSSIIIPGRTMENSGELNDGTLTSGFFPVLRVPLRRGRLLNSDDLERKIVAQWSGVPAAEPVVVNDAFVRRFFPDEDPVGRKFGTDPTNKTYGFEIVGVVGDMRRGGLERPAIPEYFGPWIPSANGRVDLLVRANGDAMALSASVRAEAKRAIPGVTVVSVSTADALLGGFSALRRLQTWLLTGFALLALALAGIGIFGLVHFTVAERTREIGIRVALGASPRSVMRLVLKQGMRSPVAGILIGLAAALALTRLLSSLLFGVGATDPVTFAAVAIALASIAAFACWLASRKALRIDPLRTLR